MTTLTLSNCHVQLGQRAITLDHGRPQKGPRDTSSLENIKVWFSLHEKNHNRCHQTFHEFKTYLNGMRLRLGDHTAFPHDSLQLDLEGALRPRREEGGQGGEGTIYDKRKREGGNRKKGLHFTHYRKLLRASMHRTFIHFFEHWKRNKQTWVYPGETHMIKKS